jgi:hypothetical protein
VEKSPGFGWGFFCDCAGFFEGGFGKTIVFELVFCGEVVVISW